LSQKGRFICPWALCRRVLKGALLLAKVKIYRSEDDNESSNRAFYETGG